MFQFFVVFHKEIFDKCYAEIDPDLLHRYFTFIAVNETIPKTYTEGRYKVIQEWDLPIYDAGLQKKGYKENSAIYHVYANQLHKAYDFIGFFQYDMVFNSGVIEYITHTIDYGNQYFKNRFYFAFEEFDFYFCSNLTWNNPALLQFILEDYEAHFKTPMRLDGKYPLFNTYVLSTSLYEHLMEWVSKLYGKIELNYTISLTDPNWMMGGVFERVMAFAIGSQMLISKELDISHEEEFKVVPSSA